MSSPLAPQIRPVAEKKTPSVSLTSAVLVALVESSDALMADRKEQIEIVKQALSESRDLSPAETKALSRDPYLAGVLLAAVVDRSTDAKSGDWA